MSRPPETIPDSPATDATTPDATTPEKGPPEKPEIAPSEASGPDGGLASPENEMIDAITANQQEALMTAEAAGRAVYEGLGEVQREIAGFVAERIRRDFETQQALMRCRSFDDFREVQSQFFRTAIDQYSAETSRLAKLSRDIVARTVPHQAE